jgi:hypothetical protein
MGKIVTNSIRSQYKSLIKQVIKDLGEGIDVYSAPLKEQCPNCKLDLVTKKSKNVYDTSFTASTVIFGNTIEPQSFSRGRCPVCKGDGYLFSLQPKTIKALVKWDPDKGDMDKTPAGYEGKNIVRVKASKSYYSYIRDCEYAYIDGVKCELFKPPTRRGLGATDELVVAYFQAVETGKSVKE